MLNIHSTINNKYNNSNVAQHIVAATSQHIKDIYAIFEH